MIIVPGHSSDPDRPDSNPDTLPDDIQYDGTRPTNPPINKLNAPPPYKLTGWAWSSNIGWISLSSDNVGDKNPYGVQKEVKGDTIDKVSGRSFKGYAWSPNIGWIKFDAAPYGFYKPEGTPGREVYPEAPNKSSYLNTKNSTDNDGTPSNWLGGWARVCSATIEGDCDSPTGDYDGHQPLKSWPLSKGKTGQ